MPKLQKEEVVTLPDYEDIMANVEAIETIIEINNMPGIDIHHFPYKGKPRNAAGAIIDLLFPETKKR